MRVKKVENGRGRARFRICAETTVANLLAVISIPEKITRTVNQAVGILS